MAVVNKGDQVTFIRARDGAELRLRDDFCILHDEGDDVLGRCDVFITSTTNARLIGSVPFNKAPPSATDYYSDAADFRAKTLAIPTSGWKRVALIDAIWYRRRHLGESVPLEHPYAFPVPLFVAEQRGKQTFKIALPEGCSIDRGGFRWP